MLNMNAVGNRNSTPVESSSSLRPPSSRAIGSGHHLRASADMAAFPSPTAANRARPSSDFYGTQTQGTGEVDPNDKIAQQWIADIDQYELTLEEMAAATLDQDFKDELSAIEQWFRVLSEAERTAALYALLQQTTQVQCRFFVQILQQLGKNHPVSGVLSPANFDKGVSAASPIHTYAFAPNIYIDPMSSRLSDAMGKLNTDGSRNSLTRPPPTPGQKRMSGLDTSTINSMFPDAAAAIATEKAKYTQQTGHPPSSNRNSAAYDARGSLAAPSISGPGDAANGQPPASPWGSRSNDQSARPKSSSGQTPMGQFSAGLRSPNQGSNLQSTTLVAPDNHGSDLPMLSPYAGNGNWASMVNTPMVPNFNTQASANQADMVANATAMKLAALSTVNNRFALDDVRKYRRARSNDGNSPLSPGGMNGSMPGTQIVMVNEHGQIIGNGAGQMLQNNGFAGRRSRPSSPGLGMGMGNIGGGGAGFAQMGFTSPQSNNGFLTANYDGSSPLMNNGALGGLNMGQFGMGQMGQHEGYLSDHSEMNRGRSPRGRRGSSKPPEDPTDPSLLQDIPSWLRSLRLHKYTDNLKDMNWTELVELDDKALEDRGVNALGARRKMLKVFEQVKGRLSYPNTQDITNLYL